jgi:hypothetical protein
VHRIAVAVEGVVEHADRVERLIRQVGIDLGLRRSRRQPVGARPSVLPPLAASVSCSAG